MEFKRSDNFHQINEIIDELSTDSPNTIKLVKLLRELLVALVRETTAWACVEIDWLCWVINDKYVFEHVIEGKEARYNWEMPLGLEKIIDDFMLLHDYPADYAPSPQTILTKLDEYITEENIELCSVKTKLDYMVEMYEEGRKISQIANDLDISEQMVKRALGLTGYHSRL